MIWDFEISMLVPSHIFPLHCLNLTKQLHQMDLHSTYELLGIFSFKHRSLSAVTQSWVGTEVPHHSEMSCEVPYQSPLRATKEKRLNLWPPKLSFDYVSIRIHTTRSQAKSRGEVSCWPAGSRSIGNTHVILRALIHFFQTFKVKTHSNVPL